MERNKPLGSSMLMRSMILAAALLLSVGQAPAHHSGAIFDRSRTVTLEGTIVEYQFENPHVWIEVLVRGDEGDATQWSIEGEGRATMTRLGLGRTVINPGDEVTVRAHPLRDGRSGGSFIEMTLPDGRVVAAHQPQG